MTDNLFPYQLEGVKKIENFAGRALIGDEPGLGKTRQAIWFLKRNESARPAIVVCPASVKYYWAQEAKKVAGFSSSILEGQTPLKKGDLKFHNEPLVIINYDILQYWVEWLKKFNFQTVIIDENQYIQSRKTARTKAVKKLTYGVPNVIALSGTPFQNRPIELFPTLNILDPKTFKQYWAFGQKFCGPKHTPWGIKFDGASNTDELHQLLISTCMIRRKKTDVLEDLPDKLRKVLPVDMTNPKEYDLANKHFLTWLRRQDPAKVRKAVNAQALVKMGYLKRLAARLKFRAVVDWVNDFLAKTDEKLIIFAVHQKMIRALNRRCKAKAAIVDGSVIGRNRQSAVEKFQNDPGTRLFLGNIRAAGTGLTLTAASTVLFAELDWTPGIHTQAEDRPHRIGQKDTVWIHYIVARGSIEVNLCALIQQKQQVVSSIIDGGNQVGDIDVFNQLLREMKKQ